MIIATPIILENYIDWVIMRKSIFLRVFAENSDWKITAEEILEKNKDRILWDFGDYLIIDRKFYDISILKWQYF